MVEGSHALGGCCDLGLLPPRSASCCGCSEGRAPAPFHLPQRRPVRGELGLGGSPESVLSLAARGKYRSDQSAKFEQTLMKVVDLGLTSSKSKPRGHFPHFIVPQVALEAAWQASFQGPCWPYWMSAGNSEYEKWSSHIQAWNMESAATIKPSCNFIVSSYAQGQKRWTLIDKSYMHNIWRSSQSSYLKFRTYGNVSPSECMFCVDVPELIRRLEDLCCSTKETYYPCHGSEK